MVGLFALAAISRPLLFATLAPELAEAKGVSLRLVSVLFLAIVAIAVAEAAQVVGVLLVFALMVGPAAAALALGLAARARASPSRWFSRSPRPGAASRLAYVTDWPTTFWIVLLSCLVYFLSFLRVPVATEKICTGLHSSGQLRRADRAGVGGGSRRRARSGYGSAGSGRVRAFAAARG